MYVRQAIELRVLLLLLKHRLLLELVVPSTSG